MIGRFGEWGDWEAMNAALPVIAPATNNNNRNLFTSTCSPALLHEHTAKFIGNQSMFDKQGSGFYHMAQQPSSAHMREPR